MFKTCAAFTDSITETNKKQVDDTRKIDVAMHMYKLIEYSDAYSRTSGSFWQYYRDEPDLDSDGNIIDFPGDNNNSASFKFKPKITGQTGKVGTKNVELMVPLKYLSNFWRPLEMPLINCEVSLQMKWSGNCIIVAGTANYQNQGFQMNNAKIYVPVVTLSTQKNVDLLKEIESGFKGTFNWNKYVAQTTNPTENRYSDFLTDPSFQWVNRHFALLFKDDDGREIHKQYYLPTVEIKDYNVMIDWKNLFDQPIKNDLKTYDDIRKIVTGRGDDYTTGCLLDYP